MNKETKEALLVFINAVSNQLNELQMKYDLDIELDEATVKLAALLEQEL